MHSFCITNCFQVKRVHIISWTLLNYLLLIIFTTLLLVGSEFLMPLHIFLKNIISLLKLFLPEVLVSHNLFLSYNKSVALNFLSKNITYFSLFMPLYLFFLSFYYLIFLFFLSPFFSGEVKNYFPLFHLCNFFLLVYLLYVTFFVSFSFMLESASLSRIMWKR